MREAHKRKENIDPKEISPGQELGDILYSRINYLYRVCYRILLNKDEAEEAVAETMYRAVSKFSTFKGESQLETWLYRIATNVCLDFLRRRRTPVPFSEESNPHAERDSQNAEEIALSNLFYEEKSKALNALLDRLKPRLRIVLIMREVEGLSYEDIALKLRCALGTVKSMINRAKKEALRIIEEDEELKAILLRQKD